MKGQRLNVHCVCDRSNYAILQDFALSLHKRLSSFLSKSSTPNATSQVLSILLQAFQKIKVKSLKHVFLDIFKNS